MAIKTKLNSAWTTNKSMDAVFEVRAQAENVYRVLQESIARINEIVSGASFGDVDAEIKSEGQDIIDILNQSKTALDGYKDFLEWRQVK